MPFPRLSARISAALFIAAAQAPASFAQSGGPYDLRSSTIDGGGGTSAAGTYRVDATIGQPDAGSASGGSYVLGGGFWAGIGAVSTPSATLTGTVPPTPTATAPPSPTQSATAVPTTPGVTPTPSVPLTVPTSTPSSNPTSARSPSTTATPLASPTPSPTPRRPACIGACHGDGQVTVDEILTLVNIALGNANVSTCLAGDANHDSQITVDEILAGVNNALNGCGG